MRMYKTGDLCPCCGQPIQHTDPGQLRRFSMLVDVMGLGTRRAAMKKMLLWLDNDRHFRWGLLAADLVSILMCGAWVSVLLRVLEAAG